MTSSPIQAVRRYIDAFNNGDVEVMASIFDVEGSILDGMPPHAWHGPTATRDWYRDVMAEAEHHGASDYFVALDEPLHETSTGDYAYVALPATMTFDLNGQNVTQSGALLTMALRQRADGWRVTAWAWTKGKQ